MTTTHARSFRSNISRHGFTLIELLVVIAIIAILAAILFPVFAQAREKARQSACLSNTKQIALGLVQYTQDYDETMPFQTYIPTSGSSNSPALPKWMDMIYPYIKSQEVFSCPNIDSTTQNQYVAHNMNLAAPNRTGARYGTYGANTAYFTGLAGSGVRATPVIQFVSATNPPTSLADIKMPASTVAVTEMFGTTNNATISWANATTNPVLNKTTSPYWSLRMGNSNQVGLRHNNGANVTWCDGHSKWARGEELSATHSVNGVNVAYLWTAEED